MLAEPVPFVPTSAPVDISETYQTTHDIDADGLDELVLSEPIRGSNDDTVFVFDSDCG